MRKRYWRCCEPHRPQPDPLTLDSTRSAATMLSAALARELRRAGEEAFRTSLKADYETDGFVGAAARIKIRCHCIPDLAWAEIDDEAHLEQARSAIWPRILQSS